MQLIWMATVGTQEGRLLWLFNWDAWQGRTPTGMCSRGLWHSGDENAC